ncbi:MAG: hypothetical protein Q8L47_00455 [bacterium]|nr:hypothetical protein [bacterium]
MTLPTLGVNVNIYVVVEGVSEYKVYPEWIKQANPALVKSSYIDEVVENNFYMIGGGGYPYIFNVIDNAISDTNDNLQFDRLVIALDSEDFLLEERYLEIESHVRSKAPRVEVKIIIQHFCFETWALGNVKIGPKNPTNSELKAYKEIHNVIALDPEHLPELTSENLNRAQFAYKYLKLAVRDKGHHITYSKNKPDVVFHPKYFNALKDRLADTGHIGSFSSFLIAFI